MLLGAGSHQTRAVTAPSAVKSAIVPIVRGAFCQRIGHGGASVLAPANTLESFDAALEVGVDMVEFDVRAWRGELVLAHTILDARQDRNPTFDQALQHLSSRRFRGVDLNVDLKRVGCEPAVLDALRRHGLLDRTLISCQVSGVLDRVRALEPGAHTGISIGGRLARVSRRWRDWRAQVLAGLASRRWQVVMAQHRLVDAVLLEDVAAGRGRVCAWTVNERPAIERLRTLGIHGIVTGDPRLFS
jgi:glycerophosphoryl diester phosphodiesterase